MAERILSSPPRPRMNFLAARWGELRAEWRLLLFCYMALAPVMALFAYARVFPIAWSVVLSFYRWDLIRPLKPFIGLRNYTDLLGDENFRLALENTLIGRLVVPHRIERFRHRSRRQISRRRGLGRDRYGREEENNHWNAFHHRLLRSATVPLPMGRSATTSLMRAATPAL